MWEWWQRNRPLMLGAVLLLMALLWYSINLRQQDETNFPERVILILTGPVQAGLEQVISGAADIWGHYLYLIDTEKENMATNNLVRNQINSTNFGPCGMVVPNSAVLLSRSPTASQ